MINANDCDPSARKTAAAATTTTTKTPCSTTLNTGNRSSRSYTRRNIVLSVIVFGLILGTITIGCIVWIDDKSDQYLPTESTSIASYNTEQITSQQKQQQQQEEELMKPTINNTTKTKTKTTTNRSSLVPTKSLAFSAPSSSPESSRTKKKVFQLFPRATKSGTYEILQTLPHDDTAFTQGLVVVTVNDNTTNGTNKLKNYFLEGTGDYGSSDVRYVDIETGTVLQKYKLRNRFFGEGITYFNHYPNGFKNNNNKNSSQQQQQQQQQPMQRRLIQLTWLEETAFVYDVFVEQNNTIVLSKPLFNFTYRTTNNNEGWGITYRPDTHVFYVSDGSRFIHIWDADTFQKIKRQRIMRYNPINRNGTVVIPRPVSSINELEWDPMTGTILANVWLEDYIIRIEPESGRVSTIYDLSSLYPNRPLSADVLNGIALTYDPTYWPNNTATNIGSVQIKPNEFWITGKLWPKMFRVKLIG